MQTYKHRSANRGLVIGVDEAGRGTWAGPVTACAFAFLDRRSPGVKEIYGKLADSKILSPARRKSLSARLHELAEGGAVAFAFGQATAQEVDEVNVRQATRLAMMRALGGLLGPVAAALMGADIVIDGKDGFDFLGFPKPRYLVRGDTQVQEIMAASILAKVHRDDFMGSMDRKYPSYGFAQHKGYGTALHATALLKRGPCAQHRKTFAPVKAVLGTASPGRGRRKKTTTQQ